MASIKIYYRATYGLQFMTAVCLLVALFLPWHSSGGSAFELIKRPLKDFTFPYGFADVWWFMWLLLPGPLVGIVRGATGMFDQIVEGRRFALAFSWAAVPPLAWLYLVAGDHEFWNTLNPRLEYGFWLMVSSLVILTLLISSENLLPTQNPRLARLERLSPDDPERLWEGHYQLCPFCGSPNELTAKRCQFCGIMLLPDQEKPAQPDRGKH